MSVVSEGTEYRVVRETVQGTTPDNPAWMVLPSLSDTVVTNASTTESNLLDPSMQVRDSILTAVEVSGNLEIEFLRTPALDLMFESVTSSAFAGTPEQKLSVDVVPVYFSLMKRWPDPASPGDFLYQIYKGCMVNTISISMPAGTEVTASIGIVGLQTDADRQTVAPAGSTFPALTTEPETIRAPDIKGTKLDNEGGTLWPELAGVCVTDMTINLNRNARSVQCLGALETKSTPIGRFSPTLDMNIFFTSNNLMEEFLNQNILNAEVSVGNFSTYNAYNFVFPRGKISQQQVVVGGAGTDVLNQLTFQGILDTSLDPDTTLLINAIAEGTSAPEFVSGVVENAAASDVVVTFSENVAITDSTGITIRVDGTPATINTQVAAGSAITFTLAAPVTAGQSVTFQADNTNTITDTTDGLSMRELLYPENVTNNVQ